LLKLAKSERNPIVAPRPSYDWEVNGTFNPGAIADGGAIHLLYRAVDVNGISRFGYARTVNGTEITFRGSSPVLEPSADWEEFGCEDPRITTLDESFYITYTAYSWRGPRIALASTEDFVHFRKYGIVGPEYDDKDGVIFPERIDGKIALLHRLESKVQIAYFESLHSLSRSQEFWKNYMRYFNEYEVVRSRFPWEERKVGIGPPPIKTERGWLVIYHGVSIEHIYRAGAILLDLDKPTKIVARTSEPILEPEADFEKHGVVPNVVFPDGAVIRDRELLVYYGGADQVCCVASAPLDEFLDELERTG
jgi:predicted GH43/DUF377 family glycosyl hydrolase